MDVTVPGKALREVGTTATGLSGNRANYIEV